MKPPAQEPSLHLERVFASLGRRTVAGVDEVGRGSWAGPVVAAAVVLPRHADLKAHLAGVRDSKQLTPQERERCFQQIVAHAAAIGIGWSSHQTIDRMGIAAANRAAMVRALGHLPTFPDALILDAVRLQDVPVPQVATPRSDAASLSVAAASIVAKVVRDRWMARQSHRFPGYGFADHKGYGTPAHRLALDELGPCSIHRRSFRPIALLVA